MNKNILILTALAIGGFYLYQRNGGKLPTSLDDLSGLFGGGGGGGGGGKDSGMGDTVSKILAPINAIITPAVEGNQTVSPYKIVSKDPQFVASGLTVKQTLPASNPLAYWQSLNVGKSFTPDMALQQGLNSSYAQFL